MVINDILVLLIAVVVTAAVSVIIIEVIVDGAALVNITIFIDGGVGQSNESLCVRPFQC